ncbi:MAG: glycoside hydrolase [Opitutaceae bacterium]|jgi:hypothetical protein|nr:glycoside hydrolase [Opitutaceae bacterium]
MHPPPLALLLAAALAALAPAAGAGAAPAEVARAHGVTPLTPPWLQHDPGPRYWTQARKWQGIPDIERAPGGRLWATWYAGPHMEGGDGNYAVLVTSADDGKTWSEPVAVFDVHGFFEGKTTDPQLWLDPSGALWWVNHRVLPIAGADPLLQRSAWAFKAADADIRSASAAAAAAFPRFAPPVFIAHGVCLNKPAVLGAGEWLRPVVAGREEPARIQFYVSRDNGRTWRFLSKHTPAAPPEAAKFWCEPMLVERRDGSLWTLFRAADGIMQIESRDRGLTWENEGYFTKQFGINTRFFLLRLASGALLLVANDHPRARANMTAFLSDDDGKTWPRKLVLDERENVSYPDGAQAPDGSIYIIYDRGRYHPGSQEILFAKFTEAGIRAGTGADNKIRLKQIINRLADAGSGVRETYEASRLDKENKARRAAAKRAR